MLRQTEQLLERGMRVLAAWPDEVPSDNNAAIALLARHVAQVFNAEAVILWEDPDEPWLSLTRTSGRGAFTQQVAPRPDRELAALQLEVRVARKSDRQALEHLAGRPLFHDAGDVLLLPLPPEPIPGVIAVMAASDLLALAHVTARMIALQIAPAQESMRIALDAALNERMRLARDLHDGLLQSITGSALELKSIERTIDTDPALAKQRVRDLMSVLTDEQRELRIFVSTLRHPVAAGSVPLADAIRDTAVRVGRAWKLEVDVAISLQTAGHPVVAHDVMRIVQEALVNAVRHGGARKASVVLEETTDGLELDFEDDGRGFAFEGSFTLAQLNQQKRGPVVLKQRVAEMRGDMTLRSSPKGVRLHIYIPWSH